MSFDAVSLTRTLTLRPKLESSTKFLLGDVKIIKNYIVV